MGEEFWSLEKKLVDNLKDPRKRPVEEFERRHEHRLFHYSSRCRHQSCDTGISVAPFMARAHAYAEDA
jgi:hypothetical protein